MAYFKKKIKKKEKYGFTKGGAVKMAKKVVGFWGSFFDQKPIYKEKLKNKKYRFSTVFETGGKEIEAFSSTGKIRLPSSKPKVKSQKWRYTKK